MCHFELTLFFEDVTLVVATKALLQHELEMANTADDRTLDAVNDKKTTEDVSMPM